jgi:hypothetical protein
MKHEAMMMKCDRAKDEWGMARAQGWRRKDAIGMGGEGIARKDLALLGVVLCSWFVVGGIGGGCQVKKKCAHLAKKVAPLEHLERLAENAGDFGGFQGAHVSILRALRIYEVFDDLRRKRPGRG